MASSEANSFGSTVFSKEDKSGHGSSTNSKIL